ncbi:MAG: TRL-like family protein [Treponema sp.]|jgi:uncharacterized protein YceK|nr:TRL-like family protein [Treponema sp.]
MKKLILILAAFAVCMTIAGCASVNAPVSATSNPVGSKVGHAGGWILFTFGGMGSGIGRANAGVLQAARNGGITHISTVDLSSTTWFGGLFTTYNTTVSGE